ncbi:MAG: serine hydrolase [bacterium]|nr:serine hydrolase [bacterium]
MVNLKNTLPMYKWYFSCFLMLVGATKAQTTYFPPLTGSNWDTLSPSSLFWCNSRIDSLYFYLEAKNTKSFIILKNGKIVLEKYFGSYTKDSVFYWASASKSLASFITGIAQQKGLITINSKVSQYLGTGWTSENLAKENLINVKHLLQMTSGMEDAPPLPCDNEDTARSCLTYKVDAGSRWAYHTGAYRKVQDVVSAAAGQNYNLVTTNWVKTKTGMGGIWLDQVYYSKARDMARFGLLAQNKGIWNTDTLMKDSIYFKQMISPSQTINPAYGLLWWLNGKSTYMVPGAQLVFNGAIIPSAPGDMFAALGKNDQKIYVVPSQKLVVIRQGNSAEGMSFALSNFDTRLWEYITKLNCLSVSMSKEAMEEGVLLYPNPATDVLCLKTSYTIQSVNITDCLGQKVQAEIKNGKIDVSTLTQGVYFLKITIEGKGEYSRKFMIH